MTRPVRTSKTSPTAEPFFAPPPPRFASAPPPAAGGEQIRLKDVDEEALERAAADVRAQWSTGETSTEAQPNGDATAIREWTITPRPQRDEPAENPASNVDAPKSAREQRG